MIDHRIGVRDVGVGYRSIVDVVLDPDLSRRIAPRGEPTIETCSLLIVHHDPTDCLLVGNRPRLSQALAAVEALQLVGGFSDPEVTVAVAPKYAQFMDGGTFHGAYGTRTRDKLEHVARRLTDDPATRRAVITVWDDDLDLETEGMHDYPCTVSLGFQVRDGRLNMRTNMRSNDLWLGYPYDLFQFTTLQRAVARFIGVPVGEYVHFVDSMHVYERDLDKIREITLDNTRPRLRDGIGIDVPGQAITWRSTQFVAQDLFYAVESSFHRPLTDEEYWFACVMNRWWRDHPEHQHLRAAPRRHSARDQGVVL